MEQHALAQSPTKERPGVCASEPVPGVCAPDVEGTDDDDDDDDDDGTFEDCFASWGRRSVARPPGAAEAAARSQHTPCGLPAESSASPLMNPGSAPDEIAAPGQGGTPNKQEVAVARQRRRSWLARRRPTRWCLYAHSTPTPGPVTNLICACTGATRCWQARKLPACVCVCPFLCC